MERTQLSYIEYEGKTLNLLKNKILETGTNAKNLREQYRYIHNNQMYRFDLVEVDGGDNIITVYEIKTFDAIKSNYNYIHRILWRYKMITNANVYIVFLDENEKLNIFSFDNYRDIRRSVTRASLSSATSFSDFYRKLRLKCKNESGLRYFFRGHSDYTYGITPSIFRDNNIENEGRMYLEAIRNNPFEFTEDMSTFDKLVKMQHYNLPTRLLDITTNPLVALYFACIGEDKYKKNGEVVIFKVKKEDIKYFDSDAVCILSNISKRPIDFCVDTSLPSNQQPQIHQLLHDIQQEKSSIKDIYDLKVLEKVFCVLPKMDNQRIIRQSGAFFLFGINSNKKQLADFVQTPLRIVIDKTAKKNILKELSRIGIENSTLFPEMDNRMNRIKEEVLN